MTDAENDLKPWYRQFWAWFILSPLILVVIVSSITVTLAVKGADDRVIDNYYKEGRMINMRQDEDLLAQALGVKAELFFERDIDEMVLRLNKNKATLPDSLMLEFSHPVMEERDHFVRLDRIGENQYHAEIVGQRLQHRWYLRLMPAVSQDNIAPNGSVDMRNVSSDKAENNGDEIEKMAWRLRGEIDFAKTNTVTLQPDIKSDDS